MIGRMLGRYRITASLGEGGMATVWRAEDTLLGRTVALKLLSAELTSSPEARRRFRRESDVAQLLDHPAIVPVFEHGETDGRLWLALALVDGVTLADRLKRGLPPLLEASAAVGVVASALGYAHTRGVLHRDLSTRNIMLARDGRVLLLDFGLAWVEGASLLTRTGTLAGTVPYLAPEVLAGARPDPRSDLYSLAAVLFEIVTGTPPHRGASVEALLHAKLHTPPPRASELRAGVPPGLDQFLERALHRDPARRFVDAEEFLRALHEIPGNENPIAAGTPADPAAQTVEWVRASARIDGTPGPARADRPGEAVGRGAAVVYLGVPEFQVEADADGSLGRLAQQLAAGARARLGEAGRTHVLIAADPLGVEARAWADHHGANLLLLVVLASHGEQVRVRYTLHDPAGGVSLGGGVLTGSRHDVIAFEDRFVEEVRARLPGASPEPVTLAPRPLTGDEADRMTQALRYLERHDHEPSVDAAIGLLERITSHREDAEALAALTHAYLTKHALTHQHAWQGRAAAALARALTGDPASSSVRLAHAELLATTGQHEKAREEYAAVLQREPERYEGWLGLARLEMNAARYEAAEHACRRAIALRSRDWRGYSTLGSVYFRQGQYGHALGPWRRVMRLSPGQARAASNLAVILFQLDRFEESEEAFRQALAIEPTPAAWSNYGTVLYAQHRFREAMGAFMHACELRHADARYWGYLGSAARWVPGEEARAAQAFSRGIGLMREHLERDPSDGEGWAILAGWLAAEGDAAGARAALARGLALAPEDMRCLVEAIHTHTLLGEYDAALAALDRALRRGHGLREFERSPELEQLRRHPEYPATVAAALAARPGSASSPPHAR